MSSFLYGEHGEGSLRERIFLDLCHLLNRGYTVGTKTQNDFADLILLSENTFLYHLKSAFLF